MRSIARSGLIELAVLHHPQPPPLKRRGLIGSGRRFALLLHLPSPFGGG